jgi:hypothetical protein
MWPNLYRVRAFHFCLIYVNIVTCIEKEKINILSYVILSIPGLLKFGLRQKCLGFSNLVKAAGDSVLRFLYFYYEEGFLWSFCVLYSAQLHLPPLRFHCVGGCWNWSQDCCDLSIGARRSKTYYGYYVYSIPKCAKERRLCNPSVV